MTSLPIIAILLFAVVTGWTYFATHNNAYQSGPQAGIGGGPNQSSDKNFNTRFQTLLPEHGNIAVMHLMNLYDGKDTNNTEKQLEDNAQRLGDVIKEVGTSADRELFLRAFRGHIKDYETYTKARKENDQSGMNTAKENLHMHAMDLGNLTHKLMPTISEQRATELMSEHVGLTLAIVDAHANGETAKKLNEMKNANTQAVQFGGELAKGAEATLK